MDAIDDFQPSIFDLTGWAHDNHPEFIAALRYIGNLYEPLFELWTSKGRPDLSDYEEPAP